MHRKWVRLKCVSYFLIDALFFFNSYFFCEHLLSFSAPSWKALKKSTSWEIAHALFSVVFSFCWVLEVVTSVKTAPYPFCLVFVPMIASNGRRYNLGELLSRDRFCAVTKKFLCPARTSENYEINWASAPGFYLTFISFALFDLSNRRWSKKMIFTCYSVLTDFCHILPLAYLPFLFEL